MTEGGGDVVISQKLFCLAKQRPGIVLPMLTMMRGGGGLFQRTAFKYVYQRARILPYGYTFSGRGLHAYAFGDKCFQSGRVKVHSDFKEISVFQA